MHTLSNRLSAHNNDEFFTPTLPLYHLNAFTCAQEIHTNVEIVGFLLFLLMHSSILEGGEREKNLKSYEENYIQFFSLKKKVLQFNEYNHNKFIALSPFMHNFSSFILNFFFIERIFVQKSFIHDLKREDKVVEE